VNHRIVGQQSDGLPGRCNGLIELSEPSIDLSQPEVEIWERDGERTETIDHSSGDYPRWIDTSVMLADPLTKAVPGEKYIRMFKCDPDEEMEEVLHAFYVAI